MRSFFFVALFLACSCVDADETYINGRKALITEIQEFGGLSSDPSVAPVHKARIFYQTSSDTLKLSLNGGAYSSLLTTETDPIVGAVNGIVKADGAGNISAIPDNSSNWDTAYGWGDHAAAGYVPYSGATGNVTLGNYSLTASGLQIGEVGAGSGSTSPKTINLGDTYSTMNGEHPKLTIYEDSTGYWMGLGVSLNRFDYRVPYDSHHVFYSDVYQLVNVGMNGLTFGNVSTNPICAYVGDSLTAGLYATHPYTYYITLPTYNGLSFTSYNFGISGQTIETLLKYGTLDKDTYGGVDAYYSNSAGRNILVVWAGAADIILYSTTPAQAFSYLEEYCKNRRRAGWKVIVSTMISAVDNDANKNTYNGYIRTNWPTFADGLADIAAEANLGADGAYANTTYFNADGIHLTDTGTQLVAPIVQAAIVAVNSQTTPERLGQETAISFVVDGQGQAIAANPEWHQKVVPCNMTVTSWHLDGDVESGNVELDVKVSTASPYTSYTSICGTEKPNITGAYTNTSSTLSGWTISLTEGSRLRIYPTAGATHKKATLTLVGDKT